MKTKNKFYNINLVVNANTTKLVNGQPWITWMLDRKKEGHSYTTLNRIAEVLSNHK